MSPANDKERLPTLHPGVEPQRGVSNGTKATRSRTWRILAGVVLAVLLFWHGCEHFGPSREEMTWRICEENADMMCGYLNVPTDYNDPSVGTTTLAMTKIPAQVPSHQRKGSLLINYGGPGVPGYTASFTIGLEKLRRYAPSYDIISFDQRGMGRTTPAVNCHGTALASAATLMNTVHETSFDVPTDPFSVAGTRHMVTQQRDAMAIMRLQADLCAKHVGAEVLKYMGTTTLVKDMERINAVLEGEDAKINFLGGSYGTIVADYLLNMLPHKVGKVVAWGVADPVLWATEHYEDYDQLLRVLLLDSEPTLERYMRECHDAGPDECPLARWNDTSFQDIIDRIDRLTEDLYEKPLVCIDSVRPGVLTSGMVRSTLFEVMQAPDAWHDYTTALNQAIMGNGTAVRNRLARALPVHPPVAADGFQSVGQGDLTRLAVACADSPPYLANESWPTAEAGVAKLQGILKDVSPHFGATVHMREQHGGCQFWPRSSRPVERFTGPWNSTLANVALVVSNTHDPVTPAKLGRDMAARFDSSARHLVQDAAGHSYLAEPVDSLLQALQAYFENGTLPTDKETFYGGQTKE